MSERWAILGGGLAAAAFLRQLETELSGIDPSERPQVTAFCGLDRPSSPDDSRVVDAATTGKAFKGVDPFYVSPRLGIDSFLARNLAGSNTVGGWGQVWGATWHPPSQKSMHLWPEEIGCKMPSFFRTMEQHFSVTKRHYSIKQRVIAVRRRLPAFLEREAISKSTDSKGARELFLGPSSLFISSFSEDQKNGCNQCGQCLIGCPSDHILNPLRIFRDVRSRDTVDLRIVTNSLASSIVPGTPHKVVALDRDGVAKSFEFDRVFIGLGAIQTGALMLKSNLAQSPVLISEAAMVAIPFVRKHLRRSDTPKTRIALADAFFLSSPSRASSESRETFAQIYGASPDLVEAVSSLRLLRRWLPEPIRSFVLTRIGAAMLFLEPENSSRIALTLRGPRVSVEHEGRIRPRSTVSDFSKDIQRFGIRAIGSLRRVAPPGHSYHHGASFPMISRVDKQDLSNWSDEFGRPNGLDRIHIIDSSVLPIVTSTPMAGVSMANAMRICHEVCRTLIPGREQADREQH